MLRARFNQGRPALATMLLLLAAGASHPAAADTPGPSSGLRDRVLLIAPPPPADTAIFLPHGFLDSGSDTLRTTDGRLVLPDSVYVLDRVAGRIRLAPAGLSRLGILPGDTLILTYSYLPFQLRSTARRRVLAPAPDSARGDSLRRATPVRKTLDIEDIFGRNLQKSGSIFRGFSVGSARELSISSGFRMQLAGRLGDDLEVTAALTDENTPIQPEGTTQTLQEFDRVFVDLRSSTWGVTLGDFAFGVTGGEFARVSRKLQGAQVDTRQSFPAFGGDAVAAGATTRGKFHTNQFNGADGVQGPYRLVGRNGERAIILVAGTERVYLNGERMVRGETQDYVADYSTAEVRFTVRRLISTASRIVVDFEYSDRQYSRSFIGGSVGGAAADSLAMVRFTYLREADDPDAPIDLELPDSLRAVIAAAGDRPGDAAVSGVRRVDSNGVYVRVDSLAPAGVLTFYRFSPGDPAAVYLVTFSDVGAGRGEYARRGPGEFEYRGPGGGSYLPIVLLPLAQSLDLFDVTASVRPVAGLTLEGEFAGSSFSPNRISSTDVTRNGKAWNAGIRYGLQDLRLGGLRLGDLTLAARERRVDARFTPAERTTEVEFNRRWALDSVEAADERISEAELDLRSADGVSVRGSIGSMIRGEEFRSTRMDAEAGWKPSSSVLWYRTEQIRSRSSAAQERSVWWRHRGVAQTRAGMFQPALRLEAEDRIVRRESTGEVLAPSLAFLAARPGLAVEGPGPLRLTAEYEWRRDDAVAGGIRRRESLSRTQTYGARLEGMPELSGGADVTLRTRSFEEAFTAAGSKDIRSVLVQSSWRYAAPSRALEADLLYHVLTERSALLERVFVRVSPGTGTYRYRGDQNGNGVADEAEFEQVRFDGDYIPITLPSDDLRPVIDLRTSLRLRLSGARLAAADPLWAPVRPFTSETYVRVEEKSTEEELRKVYLLHLGSFRNDSTTIAGSVLLTQDILVLDGDPTVSARLRFQERRGLVRLAGGAERQYTRERSLRLRWAPVREISQQADLILRDDNLGAPPENPRGRRVRSTAGVLDLSYRPEQRLELGVRVEVARGEDGARAELQTADINTQSVRVVSTLGVAGQARAEAVREEVLLRAPGGLPVYELTGGRVEGKTWIWRAGLDYRLVRFIQAGASYEGRAEGGRPPVHTARAEVRAYF